MTKDEMIEKIVDDMQWWDFDTILGYAERAYLEDLQALDKRFIAQIYVDTFDEDDDLGDDPEHTEDACINYEDENLGDA